MNSPGRMPTTRQSAAKQNIAASEKRSVSARVLGGGRSRAAEERHAERFDKAGGGERGRHRQQRADRGDQEFQPPGRQLRAQQDRLERQPLGDEAVERRQCGNGGAADQEHERRLRHAVDEAAEMLHVALAGRGQHRAGAEEQQALEDHVVEHVQEPGGERERRRRHHAEGLEGERKAEPDEDDPDVLDRVIVRARQRGAPGLRVDARTRRCGRRGAERGRPGLGGGSSLISRACTYWPARDITSTAGCTTSNHSFWTSCAS